MSRDAGQAWKQLDPATREIAERVLTPKQLEAVKLLNAGYGKRTIAQSLGIDVATARDRLRAAERKLVQALEERRGSA